MKKLFKSNNGKIVFVVGIVLTFIAPFVLTRPACFKWLALADDSFANIGETIGGVTAPIVGLVGAYLIYLTLIEQKRTNGLNSILSSFQELNGFLFQSGLLEFDDEIEFRLIRNWTPFDVDDKPQFLNDQYVAVFAQRHFYPALNASLQIYILTEEIDKIGTNVLKAKALSIIELFKKTHAYEAIRQSGITDQKGNNYYTSEHNIEEALSIAKRWGIVLPKSKYPSEEEVIKAFSESK